MNKKRMHHNLNNNNNVLSNQRLQVHKKISQEVALYIAKKEAYVGFGTYCNRCKNRYNQNHLIFIRLGNFKEGYVCRFCYNSKNDIKL